jgi:lipopolysaccharide/colanic/teichoic acid biosynthesis glycosyltransferase
VANALLSKVTKALTANLGIGEISEVRISFRIFPEDWDRGRPDETDESAFYDGLFQGSGPDHEAAKVVKRAIDVTSSLLALILASPLLLLIALAVKLTSRGPVLFCQQRIGQYGRRFSFLKFRSMYVANDDTVHREYVKRYIANESSSQQGDGGAGYKLVGDGRVTPLGRVLRASSLDELPQLVNVLKGEMSLVGPRPPLPYEVECYDLWHRGRLLAARPGITGFWQVMGRSRVKFDDMVRMDLKYATSWSLWLDLKILLRTPQAVLSGNGAR